MSERTVTAPRVWLCADVGHARVGELEARVAACLAVCPAAVWVRRPEALPIATLRPLLRSLRARTRAAGGWLVVADRLDLATLAEADGVHLPERAVDVTEARRWSEARGLAWRLSSATHTLRHARSSEADVAMVSPFGEVPGKGAPLGVDGVRAFVEASPAPVVALGGIRTREAVEALAGVGVYGIALRGVLFVSDDPAAALIALLPPSWRRG